MTVAELKGGYAPKADRSVMPRSESWMEEEGGSDFGFMD